MKKRVQWVDEVESAKIICEPLGCVVERSQHAYEIATIKGDGVSLLLYPHKVSSTHNVHVRARDNGSKSKERARQVLMALASGKGLPEETRWRVSTFCTFYCKTMP